jgi:putative phage-type endonuclease
MITEEQRQLRRSSIGGSDAAAAVNLSPWKTPYVLWAEKRGYAEREDNSDNDFAHFGNVLEDVVAEEFMRRTNQRVMRMRKTISHPQYPWMTANIDRRLIARNNGRASTLREGLECKTASFFVAKEWGERDDQIPIQYLIQVMHYMAVTGWDAWHVAVLIAGNDFRTFRIRRDEEMIEDLIKREKEFWDHVLSDTPPDAQTLDDTYMRWPKDYGTPLVCSPNARRAYDRLMKLRDEADANEEAQIKEKIIIQSWMGNHTTLLDVDGKTKLCTWKHQSAKRIDPEKLRKEHPEIAAACTKVGESRVMRFTERKK